MYINKTHLRSVLFLTVPALILCAVATVSATIFTNPWIEAVPTTVTYLFIVLFHAFKHGSFEKLHYIFKHGHSQLWGRTPENICFSQLLLAGGVFAGSLSIIGNRYAALSPYGSIGLAISVIFGGVLALFLAIEQADKHAVKRAFSREIMYETIMIFIGVSVAVLLVTQFYLYWMTDFIWIPGVIFVIIAISVFNGGIFPIRKLQFKKLLKEISFILIIPFISFMCQYYNTKIFWPVIFMVLGIALTYTYWMITFRPTKVSTQIKRV